MREIVDKLRTERFLPPDGFKALFYCDAETAEYLYKSADEVRRAVYSDSVFIRGLIEFTNYCRNDCYYCGIRRSNRRVKRYRLTKEQILQCAGEGYRLGFRTFVLQGGEDLFFTDEIMTDIIGEIKSRYPDCALTLSIGEKSSESYRRFFNAGADRYLLRHETANNTHYAMLHPNGLSAENRKKCLFALKEIGYQVGCGFMVGSPFQTDDDIVEDLMFIKTLVPDMVGIGPFIPHRDTPFAGETAGSAELTYRLLAIIRLMLPEVLLPATTALGTISPDGREMGIKAGANVVMPNLSPPSAREKYALYDGKLSTGSEAAECVDELTARIENIGYHVVVDKGDRRRK